MEIQNITVEDLRRMEDKEGLVLQGCGGDPGEWVQGINDLLAQKGILLEGTTFTHVSVFQNEGLTCLLFPFEDVKLDIGKLAMWRLQTHDTFGGTWLSDYIDNRLGHEPAQEAPGKPDCPLADRPGREHFQPGRHCFPHSQSPWDARTGERNGGPGIFL